MLDVIFTGVNVHNPDGTVEHYTAEEWAKKQRAPVDGSALLRAHDARVAELLAANNREVERRRQAEQRVAELEAALLRAQHPLYVMTGSFGQGQSPAPDAARQPDLRKARGFIEDRSEWDERPRW